MEFLCFLVLVNAEENIWGSNVPLSSQIPSIKYSIKATDAK